MTAVGAMTWRRFLALLGGLSSKSRWVLWVTDEDRVINDPVAAERAVAQALGA